MDIRDVDLSTGIRMQIAQAGLGGRPLLLVHGFTGAKEDFTEWLDELAGLGWHAVAPDQRGHGVSTKPPSKSDYSFELLATDLLELAGNLWGAGARFALLGHSMGGMVAQVVALRVPERLTGLVLMDTTHGSIAFVDREQLEKVVEIVEAVGVDGLADILATREDPLASPAHRRLLTEREGYAEFMDRKFRATSAAAYAGLMTAMMDATDRLDALRSLRVPTMVIVGEDDRPLRRESRRLAEAIPGATLVVVDGAGHSPQFENPDGWRDAMRSFLDRIAAGAGTGTGADAKAAP